VGGEWQYGPGASSIILQTTDGGIDWTSRYNGNNSELNSLHFPDANTGYAVGGWGTISEMGGTILKTTDGGTTWTLMNSIPQMLYSVFFTSPSTGYILSDDGWRKHILKTIDGGYNWTSQYSTSSSGLLYSVCFANEATGYVAGQSGMILKTTDAGTNWSVQNSGSLNSLISVSFANQDTGYVVGSTGLILKTTNGGGYPVGINDNDPTLYSLEIYPNPASTEITIESATKGSISILNLSGQQLITRQFTEPKTQLDISTLPSGVYFVRLTGERTVEVGKIIKR
jgi:photosystem II stability/assembly factor-like uncharacterized protein